MRFIKLICFILSVFLMCSCGATKNRTEAPTNQTTFSLETNNPVLMADDPTYLTEPSKHEVKEKQFFSEGKKPWINPDHPHKKICITDQIAAQELAWLVVGLLPEFALEYDSGKAKFYDSAKVWVISFENSSSVEDAFLMIAIKQENAQILNIWSASSDSAQLNIQTPWEEPDRAIPIPKLPDKETAGAVADVIERAYERDDEYYPRGITAQMAWYVQEEGYWVIYAYNGDDHCPSSETITFTFDETDWRVVNKWLYE